MKILRAERDKKNSKQSLVKMAVRKHLAEKKRKATNAANAVATRRPRSTVDAPVSRTNPSAAKRRPKAPPSRPTRSNANRPQREKQKIKKMYYPGDTWTEKRSLYEELGDKVWLESLKPNGWKFYYDRMNNTVFFATRSRRQAVEGVTKFTGYEALGRQYEKDQRRVKLMLQRAIKAVEALEDEEEDEDEGDDDESEEERELKSKTPTKKTAVIPPSPDCDTSTASGGEEEDDEDEDDVEDHDETMSPTPESSELGGDSDDSMVDDVNNKSNKRTSPMKDDSARAATTVKRPTRPNAAGGGGKAVASKKRTTTSSVPKSKSSSTKVHHPTFNLAERLLHVELVTWGEKEVARRQEVNTSALSLQERLEKLEVFFMNRLFQEKPFMSRLNYLEFQCGLVVSLSEDDEDEEEEEEVTEDSDDVMEDAGTWV